jgi:hypothetical protein
MKHALLLPALFLVACRPAFLVLSPEPAMQTIVEETVATVNATAGFPLLRIAEGGIVVKMVAQVEAGPRECGQWFPETERIHIRQGCLNQHYTPSVIVHEIGHAFWLPHSSDKESVMHEAAHWWPLERAAVSLINELSIIRPPNDLTTGEQ